MKGFYDLAFFLLGNETRQFTCVTILVDRFKILFLYQVNEASNYIFKVIFKTFFLNCGLVFY